jgi:hypothetical protein
MVVFLADRTNLQRRRLHDRIKNRLDGEFEAVRRRRAEPREDGPSRVVAELDPRALLDRTYPAAEARLEVGFELQTGVQHEYYWVNWVEPARQFLVGWHQDETHDDLGPVHLQVNDGTRAVAREPAQFINSHPLDVVDRRLESLREVVAAVEWNQGRPVGLDESAVG